MVLDFGAVNSMSDEVGCKLSLDDDLIRFYHVCVCFKEVLYFVGCCFVVTFLPMTVFNIREGKMICEYDQQEDCHTLSLHILLNR